MGLGGTGMGPGYATHRAGRAPAPYLLEVDLGSGWNLPMESRQHGWNGLGPRPAKGGMLRWDSVSEA